MIKAVIFDIDGTLVDSVDLHAKAWQETFKKFGRDVPYEKVRSQIGKGGDQLLPVFFSDNELREFGKEVEEYRSHLYKTKYLHQARAFPKVRQLFERILADGKQIALASSAKEDELATYKKLAKIDDLIAEETSADDVEKSKPHPDIFADAISKLQGVNARQCIVVGDSPYDAEAARKLHVPTIGVLCGGFPVNELRQAGCIFISSDPADLLENYDLSPLGTTYMVAPLT